MNFMAYGLPILAAADPKGEVARIVHESGGGWVVDSSDPENFPREVVRLAEHRDEIRACGERARAYAAERFTPAGFAERFEQALSAATR
jgi:glycosyltransferase involved in cell wall biosynthesis